jgi:hypothetical protein
MFLGENFLIGMAPSNAQRGDIIVQFWKTDVVALLRKDFEKEVYRVIGKLYLSRISGKLKACLQGVE